MMTHTPSPVWQRLCLPLLLLGLLSALGNTAWAQGAGGQPMIQARAPMILPGDTITVSGRDFAPDQAITLSANGTTLTDAPLVADHNGRVQGQVTIPEGAAVGAYTITAETDAGTQSTLVVIISRELPLSGAEQFSIATHKLVRGLYQAAWSAASDAVYVTSAVGRPPVRESQLLKIDPQTLRVQASATPAAVPADDKAGDAGLYAVYGVAVDDTNGTVWTTNTRQNTVAVYRQSDLSLLKQFPAGTVPHARDVIVDGERGLAYASALRDGRIAVFNTKDLTEHASITLESGQQDAAFTPASLALNTQDGKLYVPNLQVPEVAVIDLASAAVEKVIPLDGARMTIGVAWDAADQRLLVAAKNSDNLLIVDPQTGQILHDVYVGAGALNVAWDPTSGLAFVSNRGAGTVAVVNPATGELVANLDGGSFPNHVTVDDQGNVFAINKSQGSDDPEGDRIMRIHRHLAP